MDAPYEESTEHFVTEVFPLFYQHPFVTLRLQPSNTEFVISKALLCSESPVFSNMFNGEFLESQQQVATLKETKDDVSVRSVGALFHWIYRRAVNFEIADPTEHISALIELARLTDKYEITGLETTVAESIKDIVICNPHPQTNPKKHWRHLDNNTCYLKKRHITSAILLPQGHPVRSALAAASVEGFLRDAGYKFRAETQTYPSFGADLLQELRLTLNGTSFNFVDPVTGERASLNRNPARSLK